MNGELGVIYQNGKQVGGFYDWEIELAPNSTIRDGWREFKLNKEISAISYFLLKTPISNTFDAEFYKVKNKQLILIGRGKIVIDLSDKTLNCRLHIPIEIRL